MATECFPDPPSDSMKNRCREDQEGTSHPVGHGPLAGNKEFLPTN